MITMQDIDPEFASITSEGLARGDRTESERALRIIDRALSRLTSEEGRIAATREAAQRRIVEITQQAQQDPRIGTASIPELLALKDRLDQEITQHLADPRLTGAAGA